MDNKIVAGGGASSDSKSNTLSRSGSAKVYRREEKTSAEKSLVKELASTSPGYVFPVRNDKFCAPKEKEFQFLNVKDGSHNLGSIKNGVSKGSFQLEHHDGDSSFSKSIESVECAFGVHTRYSESGYIDRQEGQANEKKYSIKKSISIPIVDMKESKDDNILAMISYDLKDDREARADRLKNFTEVYGKELVDISRAIDANAILLDDDEILMSFDCKKVIGLPSGIWSNGKSEWSGKCVVSLIKNNKFNRLRFHFSVAEASVTFQGYESFFAKIYGFAKSTLENSVTTARAASKLDVNYKQVSNFTGGDCSIPIPEPTNEVHTFGSCFAYRKANKELSVVGKGSKIDGALSLGSSCLMDLLTCHCNCYFFACAEHVRKNPAYFTCFQLDCCKDPTQPSTAKIDQSTEIKFEASDSWVLGGPQNTWKETTLHPTKAVTAVRNPDAPVEWQNFCGCMQYKGAFKWRCCASRPSPSREATLNLGAESPATWEVEKKEQDDIFLEFKYKKIDGPKIAADCKIIMLLDTVDKDSSAVYDKARKMVSIIGIEYGELYSQYESAEKKKRDEKEAKKDHDTKIKEKKAKEDSEKEIEEARLKIESEEDRISTRDRAKDKHQFMHENEKVAIQEAAKAAIDKHIQKRTEEAEATAVKKFERELKEANHNYEHLSFFNYMKQRAEKGEPTWENDNKQRVELNFSNFFGRSNNSV